MVQYSKCGIQAWQTGAHRIDSVFLSLSVVCQKVPKREDLWPNWPSRATSVTILLEVKTLNIAKQDLKAPDLPRAPE